MLTIYLLHIPFAKEKPYKIPLIIELQNLLNQTTPFFTFRKIKKN